MCSAFLRLAGLAMLMPMLALGGELRVCADPNNLPFSNDRQQGFENRIMSIVAHELGDTLVYVWWAQRRGQIGEALNAGLCDVIPGLGDVAGVLLTYPPYYRSTYVFVTRADEPPVSSFDDPALRQLTVGVQIIGDGGANPPPALALAERGIVANVRGFPVLGDYNEPNPPARIIDAVASGDIDVAVAWGPLAGYFARHENVPLAVTPVDATYDAPELPMAFDVSMGLRLDEGALRLRLEQAIARRKTDIDRVLADYGVPRLDGDAS